MTGTGDALSLSRAWYFFSSAGGRSSEKKSSRHAAAFVTKFFVIMLLQRRGPALCANVTDKHPKAREGLKLPSHSSCQPLRPDAMALESPDDISCFTACKTSKD